MMQYGFLKKKNKQERELQMMKTLFHIHFVDLLKQRKT